ncbi:MAG: type II secretion system protein [Gammaproteobacteria bacterium]|nr:type II secretion system protein [Gammaproteobacteria bacterium]
MLKTKQMGFTLVEIAIVMVIVGLLIGGVLKGQEMITNAKLKRIESDNAGLLAALYSYQDRYLQLPGDDADAEGRFTIYATDLTVNGDGDGAIGAGGDWDLPITTAWLAGTAETLKFFAHLKAAGLIAGGPMQADASRPSNAFGGPIGIQDGALGMSGQVTIFGGIDGPIARILDGRLDDGDPDLGRVQSQDVDSVSTMAAGGVAETAYDDETSVNMAFRL